MSKLIINDLTENRELDTRAMAAVRGGMTANINNAQQANQVVVGGLGPVFAVNAPVSNPVTMLSESNPVTQVNMNLFNLMNAFQNGIVA